MADDSIPPPGEAAKVAERQAKTRAQRMKWRLANAEHRREYQRSQRAADKKRRDGDLALQQAHLAKQRARYHAESAETKELRAVMRSKYHQANREAITARMRERARQRREEDAEAVNRKKAEWRQANLERVRGTAVNWHKANPHSHKISNARRRARKRAAEGSYTKDDIAAIYAGQNGQCVYCQAHLGQQYHADHVKPLAKGGSNWPENIQLTCTTCNLKKSDMDHEQFLQRLSLRAAAK